MESLGSLRTIVGIVQDILALVDTASGNKSRRGKLAKRVRCLRDLLLELDGAQEERTITGAAMRSLVDRLKEALSRARRQMLRCQRGGVLWSLVVAGGRMGDPLDEVEREIDRCVQDLNLAMCVRVVRLVESRLLQQDVAASTDNGGGKDEGKKGEFTAGGDPGDEKGDRALLGGGAENAEKDEEDTTAAGDVTAIGVPVCTGRHDHDHEMAPSMSYGYCYCHGHCHCHCQWRFSHGHGTGDSWHYAAAPSNPAYYYTGYSPSPHPSMFSDDNPNACSII